MRAMYAEKVVKMMRGRKNEKRGKETEREDTLLLPWDAHFHIGFRRFVDL